MSNPRDRGKSYSRQVWETVLVMVILSGLFAWIAQTSAKVCR